MLEDIQYPADLRALPIEQLPLLCNQLRQRIIHVLADRGGHLASNIGSVELIVALHKVFNTPRDKIIFDTGHQTYAHKLLSGRNDLFPTVRQYRGLSGFTSPKESPYDHFFAGHAGTALSLALGLAKSRDLIGSDEYIIPFLGDAAFSCGLTLEALNNISCNTSRFIILLNDNDMFISNSVGNMNRCFRNYTTSSGSTINIFEQLGIEYKGPVDGHDVQAVIVALEEAKRCQGPLILHTTTQKGYGMTKAVDAPTLYHGVGKFDEHTGDLHKKMRAFNTFPQVFGKHIVTMGDSYPDMVVVTPAMPHGACLTAFMEAYPNRCIDVGIAEGHAVTYAAGIAYQNRCRVLVSIYATFLQRAMDNLFQDVCLQEIPLVFVLDRGGLSPADGSTHHGVFDIGFLSAMPNLVITQPRDGNVLRDLLQHAFSYEIPFVIRYPNQETKNDDAHIPTRRQLGKGEILREGKDLVIIALGHMCHLALSVAEALEEIGISATVVDPIFIKPFDTELLFQLLLDHVYFVTIEEHSLCSGLGSIVSSVIVQSGMTHARLHMFGIPDTFIEHGDYASLLEEVGLTKERIFQEIINQFSMNSVVAGPAAS